MPRVTAADRVEAITTLRRLRLTGAEISWILGMPLSTVHAVLKRVGLGKLSRLDPIEPANRYQRRWPGELVHIDIKETGPHRRCRACSHRHPTRPKEAHGQPPCRI
jgi:hypothetical protein